MIAEFTIGLFLGFAVGVLIGGYLEYWVAAWWMPAVWRYRRRKMP